MKLAVFDVDGTVLRSNRIDTECYVRACEEALGIRTVDTRWHHYVHTTDPGVTREIFARAFGRPPRDEEIERLRVRFLGLLARALEGSALHEVPGARAMLARLAAPGSDWRPALATGAWGASARFKLRAARIPIERLPFASGDDADSRVGIVRTALTRAGGRARFERVVAIGDAVWDVEAARRLGLPLIGIAAEGSPERLAEAGASHVLDGYEDSEAFFRALEGARVPAQR